MTRPMLTPEILIALVNDMGDGAAIVWLYLWTRAGSDTGWTNVGPPRIATDLQTTRSHVYEKLKRLEAKNWLRREWRPGVGTLLSPAVASIGCIRNGTDTTQEDVSKTGPQVPNQDLKESRNGTDTTQEDVSQTGSQVPKRDLKKSRNGTHNSTKELYHTTTSTTSIDWREVCRAAGGAHRAVFGASRATRERRKEILVLAAITAMVGRPDLLDDSARRCRGSRVDEPLKYLRGTLATKLAQHFDVPEAGKWPLFDRLVSQVELPADLLSVPTDAPEPSAAAITVSLDEARQARDAVPMVVGSGPVVTDVPESTERKEIA